MAFKTSSKYELCTLAHRSGEVKDLWETPQNMGDTGRGLGGKVVTATSRLSAEAQT